jgi:hypothetical protein
MLAIRPQRLPIVSMRIPPPFVAYAMGVRRTPFRCAAACA